MYMKMPVSGSLLNEVASVKICNFIEKEVPAQVFSCKTYKIAKNKLFSEHFQVTASGRTVLKMERFQRFLNVKV